MFSKFANSNEQIEMHSWNFLMCKVKIIDERQFETRVLKEEE